MSDAKPEDVSAPVATVTENSPKLGKHKLVWIVALLAVLVGGGVVTGIVIQRSRLAPNQVATACTTNTNSHLLKEAATASGPTGQGQLKQITAKIQKLRHYDHDPNCLYVVVQYYISTNDSKNATLFLDKLEKLHPNDKFSPVLGKTMSVADFKAQIEHVIQQANRVCSDQVIREAAPKLNESKVADLEPIAKKVEQTKRFDKDVNCLYIVTAYYMYKGDLKQAQTYVAMVDKIYDSKKGFSPLFHPVPTLDSLHKQLAYEQKFQDELKRNSKILSGQKP